ncbi:4-amino-4-deoxychorismate lyase [Natronocella acetinitrilica]|uniref:Aminodeoxychorismate lyase n=1 Tax=Natronocella acetinitrilica TaxID=414046 RepID=A0AAE3KD04_9GAMM|nr:aminodeoxychorismate lyase [Natronocella acetinitrilica]MCP1676296.1 4-amino-4-deoxychorismate lyase [Natronocella acetinitrilica]
MTMRRLINGTPDQVLEPADRGFMYGDGLFETMLWSNGVIPLWTHHMERLQDGCSRLGLTSPDETQIAQDREQLCQGEPSGVFRLQITAGVGGRGYARPPVPKVTRVAAFTPVPRYPLAYWRDGIAVHRCRMRLSRQPLLAGLKHCNRLEYILARGEWEHPDFVEGLLLDQQGHVAEGVQSNTFAVVGDRLLTPTLVDYGVAGVMRGYVLRLAESVGLRPQTGRFSLGTWLQADEVFMTNSLIGIWPVRRIGDSEIPLGPVSMKLRAALLAAGIGLESILERGVV